MTTLFLAFDESIDTSGSNIVMLLVLSLVVLAIRFYMIFPGQRHRSSKQIEAKGAQDTKKCSIAVFLGSGGHTSEALMMLSALDFNRYSPRTYFVSDGDSLSGQKAKALERLKTADGSLGKGQNNYTLLTIPRARRVHQSLIATPPTALYSLVVCLYYVTLVPLISLKLRRPFADILVVNGPGTCFVLCAAVYVNKLLGLPSPRVIYVESFARVRTLSLSGKLLRPLVDRFVVQWPDLRKGGREEYRGWLV